MFDVYDTGDDGIDDEKGEYIPTPAEIREACLAIQAGWSTGERTSRYWGPKRVPWYAPSIAAGGIGVRISDDEAA